jgi:hypothetical protein
MKIKQSCPGIKWKNGKPLGEFDKEIIPLLEKLNKLSFCHTTDSCAGHSQKELQHHKETRGHIDTPYKIYFTVHIKTGGIKEFMVIARKLSEVSDGSFWCELGYGDDWNFKTEKGYLPFHIQVFAGTKKRRDLLLKRYEKIIGDW